MINKMILGFVLLVFHCHVITYENDAGELRKKLEQLSENKCKQEGYLEFLKKHHAWSSYVKRDLDQLYTPLTGHGGYYGEACDTLMMPFEGMRIMAAYVLFPITVPIFVLGATNDWCNEQESVDKRLKEVEENLLATKKETEEIQKKLLNLIKLKK